MGAYDDAELLQRHRLTVDDFHLMAEVGILAPDARVELIEGELIDMAPMKSQHAAVVRRLERALVRVAGEAALVSCQLPLRLAPDSELEPDLMLLRYRADDYEAGHPQPADVLMLIEVSDTTLAYDTRVKLPLYARHGVRELWIVDLTSRRVRVCRQPQQGGYAEAWAVEASGELAPEAAPALKISLEGLFG